MYITYVYMYFCIFSICVSYCVLLHCVYILPMYIYLVCIYIVLWAITLCTRILINCNIRQTHRQLDMYTCENTQYDIQIHHFYTQCDNTQYDIHYACSPACTLMKSAEIERKAFTWIAHAARGEGCCENVGQFFMHYWKVGKVVFQPFKSL